MENSFSIIEQLKKKSQKKNNNDTNFQGKVVLMFYLEKSFENRLFQSLALKYPFNIIYFEGSNLCPGQAWQCQS